VAVGLEQSKLRLFGLGVLCGKIAIVPLVFDHTADFPFTVPKALVSHGLSYVLVGVIAGLLLRFGRPFFVWSWLHVPVAAFLVVNVLASVFAVDRTLALFGTHARMLGLGTIADGVSLYFAVVLLVRRRHEAIALIGSALGASVLVLAYEAVQLMGKDPFVWSINGVLNPFSTVGQPTTLAHYLTVLAVGVIALGAFVGDLSRRLRVALFLYSCVLFVGAAATGTRSSLVGMAAGLALIGLLAWLRNPSPRSRRVIALAMAGGTLLLTSFIVLSPVGARVAATVERAANAADDNGQLDPSTLGRLGLYSIAIDIVVERPILGYGPDNFVVGVPTYRSENSTVELRQSLATSAHGWLADVATSSGLLGVACFVSIIIAALGLIVRSPSTAHPVAMVGAALLAGYVGAGLTTVSDVATQPLLWLSLGAIGAVVKHQLTRTAPPAANLRPRDRAPGRRDATGIWRLGPWLPVGAGALLALSVVTALEASRSDDLSGAARAPGRVPEAIELAKRATTLDSGRAEYWHGLGLAYVAATQWRDAVSAFEQASRLAPYEIRYLTDEVAALTTLGDSDSLTRAISLAEQAVRTDPNNPRAQLTRANVMQLASNRPEALRSVERALALDPDSNNDRLYITATQVYLESGRPAEAVRVARQGLAIIDRVEISVRSFPIRFELARALATAGQPQEALDEVDLILRNRPNYPGAERLRAEIRARLPG
jgi:tetratricopeptide (TPR) repeat protein/O-antigen ligase